VKRGVKNAKKKDVQRAESGKLTKAEWKRLKNLTMAEWQQEKREQAERERTDGGARIVVM
jgi:hypothetical protein